jgi:hypothetical protein
MVWDVMNSSTSTSGQKPLVDTGWLPSRVSRQLPHVLVYHSQTSIHSKRIHFSRSGYREWHVGPYFNGLKRKWESKTWVAFWADLWHCAMMASKWPGSTENVLNPICAKKPGPHLEVHHDQSPAKARELLIQFIEEWFKPSTYISDSPYN